MASPQIALGTLNRLRASVTFENAPELNVTSSFLTREGIRWNPQGEMTQNIQAMAGTVTSPEPYVMVQVVVNIVKSQPLADLFKQRWESNTVLGNFSVRPDVVVNGIGIFDVSNGNIANVGALEFNGERVDVPITLTGYYIINSTLWG